MNPAPGSRLGHYDIVSALGAGGMGEVYRARDTRLNRDVALKFLPDAFATDAERLARFQREAHVLASLNHPNVAAIYGLEDAPAEAGAHVPSDVASGFSRTIRFLVMELVEGEDLSHRIARGPITLADALPMARQIAAGLEAAHEQGIVHRDLKPANIKLRPDGTVKVLDFGLAKATEGQAGQAGRAGLAGGNDVTNSPTITSPAQMTGTGTILGTAAYMSPEQAKGRPVDRRADVWAFGAVLYEMLTGKRCFYGTDVSDTLAAILRAEPDWSALPADTPPAIRRLLHRCLEKDLRERQSDIAMARLELRDAEIEARDERRPAIASTGPRVSALRRAAPYAAVGVASIVTGFVVWQLRQPVAELRAPAHFSIELPDDVELLTGRNPIAISPDGTRIAYSANSRLYVQALSEREPMPIAGTEVGGNAGSGRTPFFSPDSQWIGFWQQGQLKKVAAGGGALLVICDAGQTNGLSWAEDTRILWGTLQGVMAVDAGGGKPERLIALSGDERANHPQALPGGEWILFTLVPGIGQTEQSRAVVQSTKSGERRVLLEGIRDVSYLPSGHLLFGRGNTLIAQRFDLQQLTLQGGPVTVLDEVSNGGAGIPQMHVTTSSTGTLLYMTAGPETAASHLVLLDRDGTRTDLPDSGGMTWFPRFSPDGNRVAYGLSAGSDGGASNSDLWTVNLARGARTRVTSSGNNRFYPIWTPDGSRLTFADGVGVANRIRTARADGTGGDIFITESDTRRYPTSWLRDASALAIYTSPVTGPSASMAPTRDLAILRREGQKYVETPFVVTAFEEMGGVFSPSGRWLAYVSNRSGANGIYARPYPGPGEEVTISVGGGQEPVWQPSGGRLFYRRNGKILAVSIDETPTNLNVGTPEPILDDPYQTDMSVTAGGAANYDISPDGKRFVMVAVPEASSSRLRRIQVIVNWFDELKRRVAVN